MDFISFANVYLQHECKFLLFLMNYAPTILVYILYQPRLQASGLQMFAFARIRFGKGRA